MSQSPPSRPTFRPRGGEQRTPGFATVLLGYVLKTFWMLAVAVVGFYIVRQMVPWPAPPVEPQAAAIAPKSAAVPSPATTATGTPSAALSSAVPDVRTVEMTTAASIQKQQLASAKFKQSQVVTTFNEVMNTLGEWEREAAAWEKRGLPLLTNEEGKKIANDPELARKFRIVVERERPGNDALADARSRAEELVAPVKDAFANVDDASTPLESIVPMLREIQTQARKARDAYREAVLSAEGFIAQASGPPAEKTLKDAIASLGQEEALARAAFIDAEEKKAKDEGARLIAEERKKLAEVEAQLEVGKIRDDAERRRQGFFHAGSVWKGTKSERGEQAPATLVITSRNKDQIEGTLSWTRDRRETKTTIEGEVRGNAVTFKILAIQSGTGASTETFNLQFDPRNQAMGGNQHIGGTITGSALFRYAKDAKDGE